MKIEHPISPPERAKTARLLWEFLRENKLSNLWLVQELAKEGFVISNTTASSVMSGALVSPRGDEFLSRATRICEKYKQSFSSQPRSRT